MAEITVIEFDAELAAELRREFPGITSVRALVHHACHEVMRLRRLQQQAVTAGGGGNGMGAVAARGLGATSPATAGAGPDRA